MATEVIAQPSSPAAEDTGGRGQGERGMEAWLLVLALLVVLAADREAALGTGMADYGWLRLLAAGMAVLVGVAHLVLRRVAAAADPVLLPVVTVLNGVGMVMIHRLDLAAPARARLTGRPADRAACFRADAPLQLVWMGSASPCSWLCCWWYASIRGWPVSPTPRGWLAWRCWCCYSPGSAR